MSMELMVKAMKIKVGNPLRKLVLLKLADNANDQGECWPSYQHIADQCEISRSSVKVHIRGLEKEGLVEREFRRNGDTNQSNLFHLRLGQQPPEVGREMPEGGQELPEGGAGAARGGGAGAAPRTSHSFEPVIEPVKEPIRSAKAPRKSRADVVGLPSLKKMAAETWPSIPDDQILEDWLKVRKQHRAAITQTAINGMGRELYKAVSSGHTVEQCLQLAVERGWRGFKAEWISNAGSGSGKPGYFRNDKPTDYWEGVGEDGKF